MGKVWIRVVVIFRCLVLGLMLVSSAPVLHTSQASDEAPADASEAYSWALPEPGLVVGQREVLGILSLPRTSELSTLTVDLNGHDVARQFRSAWSFKNPWWPPGLVGKNKEDEERPGEGGFHSTLRAVAMLDPVAIQVGMNRLEARVTTGDGASVTMERTFTFKPEGRRIVCSVEHVVAGRVETEATARLIVQPIAGSPVVNFNPLQDRRLPGHFTYEPRSWTLARGGSTDIYLPQGRYRIIATRGPLDELAVWEVPPTGAASHKFVLQRKVELPGHSSVDFHVHSAASRDSLVPLEERVWGFLAGGVDLLVASDHGDITDYRPLIASLPAARGRLAALPGVETGDLVKSRRAARMGHWSVWPLEPGKPEARKRGGRSQRHGALEPADIPVTEQDPVAAMMFDAYRGQARRLAARAGLPETAAAANPVIQLNHPRGIVFDPQQSRIEPVHDWFNHAGFDPEIPLDPGKYPRLLKATASGARGLDFDAMEIWNRSSRRLYLMVRKDWFALLNQGWIRTGTANTDTHSVDPELAGYPMNIVFLPDGAAGGPAVIPENLAEAVRAGRVIGTDGPVPLLSVSSPGQSGRPGDFITVPGGKVHVQVEVAAASWIPLNGVRIWVNGRVLAEKGRGERTLETDLHLKTDSWILAEAGLPDDGMDGVPLPGLYGTVAPRGMAVGFTNPVLVDVDGNGRFDPPGLKTGSLP